MVYVVLLVVLLVVALLKLTIGPDRYAKMTEAEFEAEAKRSSPLGAGVLGLHKLLQPKRVEYLLQRDKHLEADSAESGDRPPQQPPTARNN